MDDSKRCPSIYQGIFPNPSLIEPIILSIYSLILLVGLVGNIMTMIIIKCNRHLRTPTNFYLLNLAVSDLMILMCNLPLEMLEIYHREWPLSVVFCKLRNICAEFFTCSSILTILAFTCERYFTIVHPIHLHKLSHFRRAQNVIWVIWLISFGFSLPLGLSYDIESHLVAPPDKPVATDPARLMPTDFGGQSLLVHCQSCVPKQSVAKLLSIIIIITSICFFYFPMVVIGAIYLFIGQALRRVDKYECHSAPMEMSMASQSSFSNKDAIEMQQHGCHASSLSWMKMRARYQARKVVFHTLVTVVSAFFICYAPLYLQRLLLAIINLNGDLLIDFPVLSNVMAYLYVISGITFYFGSVVNPILYNVVSNKYRRAFRDLVCCRLLRSRQVSKSHTQKVFLTNRVPTPQLIENNTGNQIKYSPNIRGKQQFAACATHQAMLLNGCRPSQSNSSSSNSRPKKKRSDLYE